MDSPTHSLVTPRASSIHPRRAMAPAVRIALACAVPLMLLCTGACGDESDPDDNDNDSAARPATERAPIMAEAAGRTVVAEVDGRPVYDDCVRTQAEAHGLDRRSALDECVDFELLAQEAERRGFARHPAVVAAMRNESVRKLLDTEIMDAMPGPESVDKGELEDAYERYRKYIYVPEWRQVTHVFAAFAAYAEKPGTADDIRARDLAMAIHRELDGRTGVTYEELARVAKDVLAGPAGQDSRSLGARALGVFDETTGDIKEETFWAHLGQRDLPLDFSVAIFEIPEPGLVSRPTRSRYGWHVIVLLEIRPPQMSNVDEAAEWLFQRLRVERYQKLFQGLVDDADVQVDEAALQRLHQAEEGPGAGSSDGQPPGTAPPGRPGPPDAPPGGRGP